MHVDRGFQNPSVNVCQERSTHNRVDAELELGFAVASIEEGSLQVSAEVNSRLFHTNYFRLPVFVCVGLVSATSGHLITG